MIFNFLISVMEFMDIGPYSLEGYSQTVQINVTSVNQEVILPCRPTHPSYSISLARATGVVCCNFITVTIFRHTSHILVLSINFTEYFIF